MAPSIVTIEKVETLDADSDAVLGRSKAMASSRCCG
jgi:hypothetical protein